MKRLLCFLLVCMLLCLTACSAKSGRVEKSLSKHNSSSVWDDDDTNNKPHKEDETGPTEEVTIPQEPTPPVSNNTSYEKVLTALIDAYPWTDSSSGMVPQYPDLSYMYLFSQNLSDIGYAFVDLDGNGQDELILTGMEDYFIYDLFTLQDDEPVQVFTSGERFSHTLYEDGIVVYHWSGGAALSGTDYYRFQNGQLQLIEGIKYDADYAIEQGYVSSYEEITGENCCFYSTSTDAAGYRPITSAEMEEVMKKYDNIAPLDYELTPLSEYSPS